jgi:hypothetical protein
MPRPLLVHRRIHFWHGILLDSLLRKAQQAFEKELKTKTKKLFKHFILNN